MTEKNQLKDKCSTCYWCEECLKYTEEGVLEDLELYGCEFYFDALEGNDEDYLEYNKYKKKEFEEEYLEYTKGWN